MPPITCAMDINLTEWDVNNISPITRDEVELWLSLNSGDFQEIIDFRADIYDHSTGHDIVFEWSLEDSDMIYSDCMYPSEDEDC
jgi:hypothetical protein